MARGSSEISQKWGKDQNTWKGITLTFYSLIVIVMFIDHMHRYEITNTGKNNNNKKIYKKIIK